MIEDILTFMGTLQVKTKWNYQSWIQIFQIKFLFLVLSFWKRIALVYFLRTIEAIRSWKSKVQIKTLIWKKVLKCLKFGFSWGKNGCYALVTHFTHVSRQFGVYCRKQKNCWGKTVLKMWSQKLTKNSLKVHKTTFRKKCEN